MRRLSLGWRLAVTVLAFVPSVTPSVIATTEAPSSAPSIDFAEAIYSVRYMGRFHQVLSPGCSSSSRPSIAVVCKGQVRVTSTSHPSITCLAEATTLRDGRSALLCENTCQGDECNTIFSSTQYDQGGTGQEVPFGQVHFTCSGSNIEDVKGAFIIPQPDPAICDGTGTPINLHVAQLGVVCPTLDGLRYVIDSLYAECGTDNQSQRYGAGYYSCLAGGTSCSSNDNSTTSCQIQPGQLNVNSDPHFFPQCIEATLLEGEDPSKPLQEYPAPQPETPREPGFYTARFRAEWSMNLESDCNQQLFTRRVSCTNGILLFREFTAQACAYVEGLGGGTVDCTDVDGIDGNIHYECRSQDAIPETRVEFFANVSDCTHTTETIAWSTLQLGILCETEAGAEDYTLDDIYVECGAGDTFDNTVGPLCYSPIPVPRPELAASRIGLAANDTTVTTAAVWDATVVMTDHRWAAYAPNECYLLY